MTQYVTSAVCTLEERMRMEKKTEKRKGQESAQCDKFPYGLRTKSIVIFTSNI